ncbi:RNA-dependent DNA polymerase [Pseudoalteromonas sp. K222D]|uniref:reverse transcriptase domain-containing protein n=1 Tax=Pseudoalteromonas sp. K222D TaxID=2820756 RepID=UPI001AD6D9A8|nr:reverse transcriptase domain-containing protein [Pseudoalteromonas sp. K222D]MBO7928054.1 RNA-dependent DNA polymerase [Pseudoalteromonas sp. K222D]
MTIQQQFNNHFAEDNLKRIFVDHVVYSGATGIDNLDQYAFRIQLDDQIAILSRKMLAGTYKFTKYKLKLVSKGKDKIPREISIPTVRDRIAMRAMCDFVTEVYDGVVEFNLPQKVIKRVKVNLASGAYTGVIKLDVSNFYPSIKHNELRRRLGKKIRSDDIKNVLFSAITSPTVSVSKTTDMPSARGVPQGLAISNILAAIYLLNIDNYFKSLQNIKYYRYVDDVMIFCDFNDAQAIATDVCNRFGRIGLKMYDPIKRPDKSTIEQLGRPFDYLGYHFQDSKISARLGSIERLKHSLVSIFTSYKHSKQKSEEFLLWRLNLRITGCVFDNKAKGWLFFFSEINDEKLLHTLDHYVGKLTKRFNVTIQPKKFVRAFKELSHKKYETSYIPNFDVYTLVSSVN